MRSMIFAVTCLASSALKIASASSFVDEWSEAYRIHPGNHRVPTSKDGRVYAKLENEAYHFKAVSFDSSLEQAIIYLNMDRNQKTGVNSNREMWPGHPGGYEYVVWVHGDQVHLHKGCAPPFQSQTLSDCTTKVLPSSDFKRTSANTVEFHIEKSHLSSHGGDLELAITLVGSDGITGQNGPAFLNNYYQMYVNIGRYLAISCDAYDPDEVRSAVVYSEVAENNYFAKLPYRQTFVAMQNQLRQAGSPFDLIRIVDLTDVMKSCKYSSIILPGFRHIPQTLAFQIRKSLFILTQVYNVGLITHGDFLTHNEHGELLYPNNHAYFDMKTLLGVENDTPVGAETEINEIRVSSKKEMFWDKDTDEIVLHRDHLGKFAAMFKGPESSAHHVIEAAHQNMRIKGQTKSTKYAAILMTQIENNIFNRRSGRVVHFSNVEVMSNSDFVWRAVQWILREKYPTMLALHMSRFDGGIFTCRNDMDQSQFNLEAKMVEQSLFDDAIVPWYEKYDFVATYFINVGNDIADKRFTDWSVMGPLYEQYLGLENEMASHSFTHPMDIGELTLEELEFEFNESRLKIMEGLKLDRLGAAQPGAPEPLNVSDAMENWLENSYFSGGYSSIGSGSPGCFGRLLPESQMIYLAPNMKFDFSLAITAKMTPEQQLKTWKDEMELFLINANSPVYHWPIHDYSVIEFNHQTKKPYDDNTYAKESFEGLISFARDHFVEFITSMQLRDRIKAYDGAHVSKKVLSDSEIIITVDSDHSVGDFSIKVNDPDQLKYIVAVHTFPKLDEYPAFTKDRVFVPKHGGSFKVTLGTKSQASDAATTRIVSMGMRQELVSAMWRNNGAVRFFVRGKGIVRLLLDPSLTEKTVAFSGDFESYGVDFEKHIVEFHFSNTAVAQEALIQPKLPPLIWTDPPSPSPPPALVVDSEENFCTMKCDNKVKLLAKTGISETSCTNIVPLPIRPCGCDLSNQGAIDVYNNYHFVSLKLACPDLTASNKKYKKAAKSLFRKVKKNKKVKKKMDSGLEYICSQICGAHAECDYFVYVRKYKECLMYACSQEDEEVQFYKDKALKTGNKCELDSIL